MSTRRLSVKKNVPVLELMEYKYELEYATRLVNLVYVYSVAFAFH